MCTRWCLSSHISTLSYFERYYFIIFSVLMGNAWGWANWTRFGEMSYLYMRTEENLCKLAGGSPYCHRGDGSLQGNKHRWDWLTLVACLLQPWKKKGLYRRLFTTRFSLLYSFFFFFFSIDFQKAEIGRVTLVVTAWWTVSMNTFSKTRNRRTHFDQKNGKFKNPLGQRFQRHRDLIAF